MTDSYLLCRLAATRPGKNVNLIPSCLKFYPKYLKCYPRYPAQYCIFPKFYPKVGNFIRSQIAGSTFFPGLAATPQQCACFLQNHFLPPATHLQFHPEVQEPPVQETECLIGSLSLLQLSGSLLCSTLGLYHRECWKYVVPILAATCSCQKKEKKRMHMQFAQANPTNLDHLPRPQFFFLSPLKKTRWANP